MNRHLHFYLVKLLYRIQRSTAGAGRVPGLKQIRAAISRFLGDFEFGHTAKWSQFRLQPLEIRSSGVYLLLDPSIWSQRMSLLNGEYYEKAEAKFIQGNLKEGDVFIDVGANIGFHLLDAATLVGQSGQCFGVEANPAAFRILEAHVAVNRLTNVQVFNRALFDADGSMELHVADPEDVGATLRSDSPAETVTVRTSRGDDLLTDIDVSSRGICKIDVEGAEYRVLRGLEGFLKSHTDFKVLLELTPNWLGTMGDSSTELLAFMAALDFTAFALGHGGDLTAFSPDSSPEQVNIVFQRQ